MPILYSFRRCPYAMRARLAIAAADRKVELREIVLRDKPAAMLDASPKGTVPVLVLPDGTAIDQSLDIMRWACARTPDAEWPTDNDAGLIATNDGAFKHHLDRYKYPERHGSDRLAHRAAATDILAALDTRLQANGHLVTPWFALADMAIAPFVRQFAATDPGYFDALPLPALRDWRDRYLASPVFAAIMPKFEPWAPHAAPMAFPA